MEYVKITKGKYKGKKAKVIKEAENCVIVKLNNKTLACNYKIVKDISIYSTALKNINLANKCGGCKYYKQLVKIDERMGFEVHYCHGACTLNGTYKQRTETCKKFKPVEIDQLNKRLD